MDSYSHVNKLQNFADSSAEGDSQFVLRTPIHSAASTRQLQPVVGEFISEQVIRPTTMSESHYPDLRHHEELPSEEENDDDHPDSPRKKVSVKEKIGGVFRKVFKKDRRGSHEHGAEESPRDHLQHETGNFDDPSNSVRLKKETPLAGHDQTVQAHLKTAFATEGLKAARNVEDSDVTQNRYESRIVEEIKDSAQPGHGGGPAMDIGKLMDLQDHRAPEINAQAGIKNAASATKSSISTEQADIAQKPMDSDPYASLPKNTTVGLTDSHGGRAVSAKEREKLDFSVRRAEKPDPILCDLDLASLSPIRSQPLQSPSQSHEKEHERRYILIHSSPDDQSSELSDPIEKIKFDTVPVRSHVGGEGHLQRSSEEWDLTRIPADSEVSSIPKPIVAGDKERTEDVLNRLTAAKDKWMIFTDADAELRPVPTETLQQKLSFERVASDNGTLLEGHTRQDRKILMTGSQLDNALDSTIRTEQAKNKAEEPTDCRLLRDQDMGSASLNDHNTECLPNAAMIVMNASSKAERNDALLDAVLTGEDLSFEADKKSTVVEPTIQQELQQPIMENYEAVRETDRAMDSQYAGTSEELPHENGSESKSAIVKVVESVELAVSNMVESAKALIIGHKDETQKSAEPETKDDPTLSEYSGGVMGAVVDTLWNIYTAGTDLADMPQLLEASSAMTDNEEGKVKLDVSVTPLAVSGEFVANPSGSVTSSEGKNSGDIIDSFQSARRVVENDMIRRESKDM